MIKVIIGIIVVAVVVYVLYDLDYIHVSSLETIRDYIKEKGSSAWSWLT